MDPSDFNLDVRFVKIGPQNARPDTEDCTSDGSGDTPGSAGIANC
ncbi:hypothetical protein ACWEJ6_49655 [Nonomuraea sp. NPDC004702]